MVSACFNEAQGIASFIEAVRSQGCINRLVLVDDGSKDQSAAIVRQQIAADKQAGQGINCQISLISLTRNFGKEAAMLAGLDFAKGRCDAAVLMDSDLQHPPELLVEMVAAFQAGAEIVTAIRRDRQGESGIKATSAHWFYSLFNHLVDSIQLVDGAGDYRLLSGAALNSLTQLREGGRFSKGLFPWIGFENVDVYYACPTRGSGQTSWNLSSLWNYALDGIFGFSLVPLKVWSGIGAFISASSVLYSIYFAIHTLLYGIDVAGFPSLIVAITFLGGIQLIGIGILGEYIGRIFLEVKTRPNYLVRAVDGSVPKKSRKIKKQF
ncbi:glycosyltransferase family 2 protein [Cyanobium sp. WAJ14-Wanaka]|uniref:glycosyltransferase family 2 protein n=1 Tax=Cyanobium sp. WAJ14-Wanaka TaxID=2823725 RepID=UPI0020CD2F1C|nr:glycosyltransferase family 2 protein [Cyanobium sp. WAJ14-Wanaka]